MTTDGDTGFFSEGKVGAQAKRDGKRGSLRDCVR